MSNETEVVKATEDKQEETTVVVEEVTPQGGNKQPSVSEPGASTFLTPVEQQASIQGWVPLAEWEATGRSKDEWRPAKEFVERGELYKSIHSTKRELKETKDALTALQRHHQYVFQKAHEQAVRDLRAEKRLAIRNEDFERVEEIETEIDEMKDQFQKEQVALVQSTTPPQTQDSAPEFQIWLDRNPWYLTDPQLRDEAEATGYLYMNKGGTKEGLLAHVEKTVKTKFPEKFGAARRSAPSAVAAVDRTSGKKAANALPSVKDLPDEMQVVVRRMIDATGMSEKDYIKQLKDTGVI